MQTEAKEYWRLYKPSACTLRLSGTSKAEVFREIVEIFVKARTLAPELADPAVQALLERERLASTGVGCNVAIPHVKLTGLDRAVLGLALHPKGVDWSALDGEPVRILFTVLRPEKPSASYDPERHRQMMGWIARLARKGDFRRFALQVSNRTELVELLKEMSGTGR